jgi:hypothetical protein
MRHSAITTTETTSKRRTIGGLLTLAVASGTFAAAALGSAPAANASCVSAFGISIGGGCSTNLTSVAIVIGEGTADARGLFGSAFTLGNGTSATGSTGALNFALAVGDSGAAGAGGLASMSVGIYDYAISGGGVGSAQIGNVSINLGRPGSTRITYTQANGIGTTAVNLLGSGPRMIANGVLTTVLNVGGSDNDVNSQGTLSGAFSVLGWRNTINAGPGPFATAVGLAISDSVTIEQRGPGINLNRPSGAGATLAAAIGADESKAAAATLRAKKNFLAATADLKKKAKAAIATLRAKHEAVTADSARKSMSIDLSAVFRKPATGKLRAGQAATASEAASKASSVP